MKGELQLRDYRIRPGHLDDWIEGWTTGIVPLRQREGFVIAGAWVDRARDRFVWLVRYSGADGFDAAEARYHALPERLLLRPNPSDVVAESTLDMVESLVEELPARLTDPASAGPPASGRGPAA